MENEDKTPWYLTRKFVLILLALIGLPALIPLWMSPRFTRSSKIWITVSAVIVTVLLIYYSAEFIKLIMARVQELKDMGVS